MINSPIHIKASILKNIISEASKSKIAGAHINAKVGISNRIALLEMEHPQEVTPLEMDNTTAHGILTKQLMTRHSKMIDMRFFWLRDRNNQQQFNIYLRKGKTNKGDYYTKNHPAFYHIAARLM